MKIAIGTLLIALLVGTTASAQEQQREKEKEKEKPVPQEQKRQEPDARDHPQGQQQQKAQEQERNQSKQSEKERSDVAKHQQQAAKQQQQQQVVRHQQTQNQQTQRDGGNRNTRRISEQEFHSHFGREHTFRVTHSEDRRFSYGGYYFVYNDPWPSDWAYTDDVYVDEIDDEYYLIDPVHPGIRLLIVIVD